FFFFQAEDGIRDFHVTGVQTCALPICILHQQNNMQKTLATLLFLFILLHAGAQSSPELRIRVLDAEKRSPLDLATVQLFNADSVLLKTVVTDSNGLALFSLLKAANYRLQVSRADYEGTVLTQLSFEGKEPQEQIILLKA